MITINFEKAKKITKDRLQIKRTPLLMAQDILSQRLLEAGTPVTHIVAEKNKLRDITNLADMATTLERLKSLGCLAVEG